MAPAPRRRRRWVRYAVIAVILLAAIGIGARLAGPQPVETTTVSAAYPSQNYTLLNATGSPTIVGPVSGNEEPSAIPIAVATSRA